MNNQLADSLKKLVGESYSAFLSTDRKYSYFCGGVILLRVENALPDLDVLPGYSIQIDNMLKEFPVDFKPLKCDIQLPPGLDGAWSHQKNCVECNGYGAVICEYEHEHTCPECGGKGKTYAEVAEASTTVTIEGLPFARKFIWFISQLQEVAVAKWNRNTYPFSLLAFKSADVIGALTTKRPDD